MTDRPLLQHNPIRQVNAAATSTSSVYQIIKNLEETNFPLPTPAATVDVGTFDAASGKFNGLTSTLETIDEGLPPDPDVPQRKPKKILVPPEVQVNAVNVTLTFEVTHPQGPLTINANGIQVSVAASQNVVSVDVGQASIVHWTISSGPRAFKDTLILQRPPIIGAGAFTVPALPVGIIYAPPQGSLAANTVNYAATSSIGTTARFSFGTENTTTQAKFFTSDQIIDIISTLVSTVRDAISTFKGSDSTTKIPDYLGLVGDGLTILKGLLGNTSTSASDSIQTTNDHNLSITNSRAQTFNTEQGLGPGVGDRIIFFRNVQVVWVIDKDGIHLSLLSHADQAIFSVRQLQEDLQALTAGDPTPGAITGLAHDTLQDLLNLDPLVADPQVDLLDPQFAGRFTLVDDPSEFEGSGGDANHPDSITFTRTLTSSDVATQVNSRIVTTDHRPGWLSFLKTRDASETTEQTTTTNSSSNEVDVSEQLSVSVSFATQGDERYDVRAFYDRIFSTFVFQAVAQGERRITGTVLDATGRPLAGQTVILHMDDRRLVTRSNAKGEYMFASSSIRPGAAMITTGATSKALTFQEKSIRVDLVADDGR